MSMLYLKILPHYESILQGPFFWRVMPVSSDRLESQECSDNAFRSRHSLFSVVLEV